ncbi:hypothetical protein M426DRAFT_188738 [Hypoxylon sp. CI-4A]|nr:hypothetical protein M426DRAFT_188738 [Hypoxylon sp. CI-4A]
MWERCDEARLPAGQDPDVVGLGTLIACAGSASIAVLCLVVQYLFFYLPRDEVEQQLSTANPIDVLLVGRLRKPFRYLGRRLGWSSTPQKEGRRWPAAFDRYVVNLGDIQLAIGFAILAYGYASLADQGLSMYHWWLIVGLVWFSVVTNLATTSYLRAYFANRDSSERWLRIILLICLVALLSFSMVPIYQIKERLADEHDGEIQRKILLATNVLCYLPGHGGKVDTPFFRCAITLIGIAVAVGLVIYGVLWLYERPSSVIFKWRDHYRGEMQQSFFGDRDIITCIRCEQRHLLLVVRPVLAFWLVLRVYADLLDSVLTEIICTAATFTWVVIRFVDIVRLGGISDINSQRWNFGQIVALTFFAVPLGSLASCLCSTLKEIRLTAPTVKIPEIPESWKSKWPPNFTRKQSEPLPEMDAEGVNTPPLQTPAEEGPLLDAIDSPLSSPIGSPIMEEVSPGDHQEQTSLENEENGVAERTERADVDAYKVLLSPRFAIALPFVGFSNLLYLVLLLALPNVPGYPSTPDVVWRTIFWYVVYQPLLLFAFFLAGMIVEERVTGEDRMRDGYRIIALIAAALSAASIFDTLYGLGGIPMSYIGMGALGLVLLVYLLYGCVARPGPLAKGKGRSRYLRDGDVEEGRPLLSEGGRRISDIRVFPVRKQKRWHGPSRRPQVTRGRRSYGTLD